MTNMKVNLDGATPMSADDPAEAKFNVALEKAQDDQDQQLSDLMANGVVSVMGNVMMRLAGDVLNDGLSDDD
jgi:hypothetical protein